MKILLHVPTEQYGFVSAEFDVPDGTTDADEIKHQYELISKAFKTEVGIPEKEFNAMLDEYLSTKTIVNGQDRYEKLSPAQRDILQAIKRTYARLKK